MSKILVALAGPSGCGKTYITEKLVEAMPSLFMQLPQVTTRPKRHPKEDTYRFIDKAEYDELEPNLFAKTQIGDTYYGTLLVPNPQPFNIVIVNKKGIQDILDSHSRANSPLAHYTVVLVGVDSEIPEERATRSKEYVENERTELHEIIEDWLVNTKEKYINVSDFIDFLHKKGHFNVIPPYKREHYVKKEEGFTRVPMKDLKTGDTFRRAHMFGNMRLFEESEQDTTSIDMMALAEPSKDANGASQILTGTTPDNLVRFYLNYLVDAKTMQFREAFFDEFPHYRSVEEEVRKRANEWIKQELEKGNNNGTN